jgi:hypothetical protein
MFSIMLSLPPSICPYLLPLCSSADVHSRFPKTWLLLTDSLPFYPAAVFFIAQTVSFLAYSVSNIFVY